MTSNSSTRNVNGSGQAVSSSPNSYAPSVPISLYREVTAELQATKATMEAIKTQNQQLIKQNQQLRKEIEKAVQSALNLRQAAASLAPVDAVSTSVPRFELQPEQLRSEQLRLEVSQVAAPMPPRIATPIAKSLDLDSPFPSEMPFPSEQSFPPEKLVIEQDSKPRRKVQPESESSGGLLAGWWLGITIVLVVVTAFGAGFLIVRPLLPSPSSK
jgi:hypothetical protein